jgi:hypothetical protein
MPAIALRVDGIYAVAHPGIWLVLHAEGPRTAFCPQDEGVLEKFLSPGLVGPEGVLMRWPVVYGLALAGQFAGFTVLAGCFFTHACLGCGGFECFFLVHQFHYYS